MTTPRPQPQGPLGPLHLLGVGFMYFLACSIVMLAVGTVLINIFSGQESTDIMSHPYPELTLAMFAQGLIGYVFYRFARRLSLRRSGYDPVPLSFSQPHMLREFSAGLGIGFLFISAVVGILSLLGYYHPTGLQWTPGILYGLALGIGAAFVEEPTYRGIMLGGLTEQIGATKAIILSSVVFGLTHLVSAGGAGADEWLGIIGIIIASSLIFAGAYYLTGRLWLGIGIHLAWNFTMGGIYGLTISGTPRLDGLVQHSEVTGPTLLTGGAFGPEGSIILIVIGLLLGAGLMRMANRTPAPHR